MQYFVTRSWTIQFFQKDMWHILAFHMMMYMSIYLIQLVIEECWRQVCIQRWQEGTLWFRKENKSLIILMDIYKSKNEYLQSGNNEYGCPQQVYGPSKFSKAQHVYNASSRRSRSNDHLVELYLKSGIRFYKTVCPRFMCVSWWPVSFKWYNPFHMCSCVYVIYVSMWVHICIHYAFVGMYMCNTHICTYQENIKIYGFYVFKFWLKFPTNLIFYYPFIFL